MHFEMAGTLYTLEALRIDLQELILQVSSYSTFHAQFMEMSYLHGFRFEELTIKNNFWLKDENTVGFQPGKGNNERYFKTKDLPEYFLTMLSNDSFWFYRIDYHTITRYFHNSYPKLKVTVGEHEKSIAYYLFRHYRIKQLSADGYSNYEIALEFGEIDVKNIEGYVNSVLRFYNR